MKILRHRLHQDDGTPVEFRPSPNIGGELAARYLVMHFTAARSAGSAVAWLTHREARASAHLVIGRDGDITQLVPFDRVAWHAGVSRWEGLIGLNAHSIGIELDNGGRLERKGQKWCAWFGTDYPEGEVMQAVHKNETAPCGWHVYTPAQLEAALEASRAIVNKYALRDVLGHEDVSPGRKCDPGPAFPMGNFRSRLFGRSDDQPPLFETRVALNIRSGPGTQHAKLPASPLPAGTAVEVLREEGSWSLVDVVGDLGGDMDVQGWVHNGFLDRTD